MNNIISNNELVLGVVVTLLVGSYFIDVDNPKQKRLSEIYLEAAFKGLIAAVIAIIIEKAAYNAFIVPKPV